MIVPRETPPYRPEEKGKEDNGKEENQSENRHCVECYYQIDSDILWLLRVMMCFMASNIVPVEYKRFWNHESGPTVAFSMDFPV